MLSSSSKQPSQTPLRSDSEGPTDDEIRAIIDSTDLWSPARPEESRFILRVSTFLAVKLGPDVAAMEREALAMQTVRAQTNIPVPRPVRVFEHWHALAGDGVLVMEYISNSHTLQDRWPALSVNQKERVMDTIGDYLLQLRHIQVEHPTRPGPLGPEPGLCFGLQFPYRHRTKPRSYPDSVTMYKRFRLMHDWWLFYRRQWNQDPPEVGPLDETDFSPLFFTHNDLNMRNVLLDDSDQLWIVDWAWSGMFPGWFEHLAMLFAARLDVAPEDWIAAIPLMAERNERIERWMSALGLAYDRRRVETG